MKASRCVVAVLLASASAATPAEPRPAWEQALALAPLMDAALAVPAFALPEVAPPMPEGWAAVDGVLLENMRGGFTAPGGLVVSLGVERLVSINGAVVARSSFTLPAVGGGAGAAASAAHELLGKGGLIQNGPGNVSMAAMAPDALGTTIIQNTLNNQTIRSQTVIHASVNSATLMQSLNFNDSVAQAIRDAVGTH